jgi:dipeptidyl aminopeptidase/acylaminoacyl peptidase
MTPDEFLDALLSLPKLYGGQVSPDGKWVAWMWQGVGVAIDIFAAPTDGSLEPVRLTETSENSFFISWTPDSESVIVAQDTGGDERFQLFQINLTQPGILHPLTEPSPDYFLRGGELHPNGQYLIYGANFDAETGQVIEPTYVYRHNLATDERQILARPNKGCYHRPRLNKPGTHILYNRKDQHPSGYPLWMVDIDGHQDQEIVNVGDDKKVYGSWLPDGGRILIRAETDTHFRVGLWKDGQPIQWLIDDETRNIEDAYVPHNSEQAVILDVREARIQTSLLNMENGEETRIPQVPGNLIPLAPLGGGAWVGKYYSAQQVTDIIRFSLLDLRPESFMSLTRVNQRTTLTKTDLAPAEDFRWTSVDGLQIQGWLYRPPAKAKGTIIYVHGGPTAHSQDYLDDQTQFFVSQGFNVLEPNYRGSTGFGRAFREAIKEDGWGGKEQDDIRTGIEALINAGIAERGKVGITGTSYGGYSSWCAITRFPPDLLAASAPICGMTDLVVDYETTRPDLRPYSEEMMGGSPAQVPGRYRERSPIHFVSHIKGRLLIVQGLRDPNVTPENVRAVKTALDQAGIEYETLVFEDEGHGIDRPENQKVLYRQLADFFTQAFADTVDLP